MLLSLSFFCSCGELRIMELLLAFILVYVHQCIESKVTSTRDDLQKSSIILKFLIWIYFVFLVANDVSMGTRSWISSGRRGRSYCFKFSDQIVIYVQSMKVPTCKQIKWLNWSSSILFLYWLVKIFVMEHLIFVVEDEKKM